MSDINEKEQIKKIQEELRYCSWKFLNMFLQACPCNCFTIIEIPLPDKHHFSYNDDVFYLEIESYEKFWHDWNSFKKLTAFI